MKRLIPFILLLLPLAAWATGKYTVVPVMFSDSILVGTHDTLWSYPVSLAKLANSVNGIAFKMTPWANDTCYLDVYFKLLDDNDTTTMDRLSYSPRGSPGDSTILEDYMVPADSNLIGGSIHADVSNYVRIGLYLIGEATDTVWVAHGIKRIAKPYYTYLIVDFMPGEN